MITKSLQFAVLAVLTILTAPSAGVLLRSLMKPLPNGEQS